MGSFTCDSSNCRPGYANWRPNRGDFQAFTTSVKLTFFLVDWLGVLRFWRSKMPVIFDNLIKISCVNQQNSGCYSILSGDTWRKYTSTGSRYEYALLAGKVCQVWIKAEFVWHHSQFWAGWSFCGGWRGQWGQWMLWWSKVKIHFSLDDQYLKSNKDFLSSVDTFVIRLSTWTTTMLACMSRYKIKTLLVM